MAARGCVVTLKPSTDGGGLTQIQFIMGSAGSGRGSSPFQCSESYHSLSPPSLEKTALDPGPMAWSN